MTAARVDDAPGDPARQARRGRGVPERVERGLVGEATLAPHAREGLREGGRRERRLLVSSGAPPGSGARALPGSPPPLQGPCGQGPQAVLTALALANPDQHPVGGHGRDLERGPLPQAPSTGIDPPQTPPSCGVDSRGQPRADGLGTQPDWQLWAGPRPHAREDRPWALQGHLLKQPDPIEGDTAGTRRDLLLMEPRAHVLADRRCIALLRSAPVVWREVRDGLEVTRWGPGSEPTPLQVFAPPVSEGRHRHPPVPVGHDLVQTVGFAQEDRGSFRGATAGRTEGTSTGETRTLPRRGLVQQRLGILNEKANVFDSDP